MKNSTIFGFFMIFLAATLQGGLPRSKSCGDFHGLDQEKVECELEEEQKKRYEFFVDLTIAVGMRNPGARATLYQEFFQQIKSIGYSSEKESKTLKQLKELDELIQADNSSSELQQEKLIQKRELLHQALFSN